MNTTIDDLSIATIRSLCIDVINNAKSGHPGIALGSAPILYTLYTKHLIANPNDPNWFNRDRFVLSAGHGSSLLYVMLHLSGYKISIDDLKAFRKNKSITPGHPEYGITPGVDATAGPLGQGIAQAVGIAMAETIVSNSYPKGNTLCSHYTYVLCGDGCLQEGISQEAISFAGHQKLNKLILLYDSNNVTLDGELSLSFSEDVKKRFESANWNTIAVNDGNDVEQINNAINLAKKSKDKPTIIIINTIIGYGSQYQGLSKTHGNPLGSEDGKAAKKSYDFDYEDFYVPDDVRKHFQNTFITRGTSSYDKYLVGIEEYKAKYKRDYELFIKAINGYAENDLSINADSLQTYTPLSTRCASQKALITFSSQMHSLIGGAADVAGSVMTNIPGETSYSCTNREGRIINFGIREFAMASIQNGILLHGGLRTYVGCFLVFSDYMKAAIRMSALSKLPAIYLFSHDSISVGEDGPTHQPIEQLAALRSIPNLNVIRPCDLKETYAAWEYALRSKNTPTAIILSRQTLPQLKSSYEDTFKGAYIISDSSNPQFIIISTGSEVELALYVQERLSNYNIKTNVVSMPSWELFENQNNDYKATVLNLPKSKRISIEMSSSFGWDKYADNHISVDVFGKSGNMYDIMDDYGFTAEKISNKILNLIKSSNEKRNYYLNSDEQPEWELAAIEKGHKFIK